LTIAYKHFSKDRGKSRENFQREFENLKRLARIDNPHIIKSLAGFSRGDNYYLMFPLADFSLKDMLRDNPRNYRRDLEVSRWMVDQLFGLASALEHLHSGLTEDRNSNRFSCTHCDLKPDNILIFEDSKDPTGKGKSLGVWKIADFGVSKFRRPTLPSSEPKKMTTFRGTPAYAAPESDMLNPPYLRMQAQPYDIWSFGCIMLEVLTFMNSGTEGVRTFEEAR
jgi:serine/threonine protein kinase